MKQTSTVIVCTAVLGLIIFIAGIYLGWHGFSALIVHEIKQGFILVNGTEAYDKWRILPVALHFKIYIFNVTNPDDVQNGVNPVVQEVGPYVYDQYREKFDIKDEGDNTLSYLQNSTFYFNKEKSGNLSEDDVVTVLNTALVGTVLKITMLAGSLLEIGSVMAEIFHEPEKLFLTATVRDLAWRGVTVVNCTETDQMSYQAKMICQMLGPQLPVMVTEHEPGIYKMAYFRHKNNSNDGRLRVNSGVSDISALGRIEEWNGRPNLTTWSGSDCNLINGTDATIFPPFCSPKEKLYIFVGDVCRSLYAEFESQTAWHGLPALHFVSGVHNFEAAEDFPPNICFCEETEDGPPDCLKSGVLDLYNCLGVSLILSLPHFYNASPDYRHYVQGLNPNKKKHETFIDIEPESGVVLRGSKRMQMNMFLSRSQGVSALSNVSEGLFPAFWIDEGAELEDKDVKALHLLYTLICAFAVIKWLLVATGLLLMCVSAYIFAFRRNNGRRIMQNEDKSRVVFYDNKVYSPKHRDTSDTLSLSTLSDRTLNDQTDIRKRWEKFPDKLHSRFETNKTSENVSICVSKEPNSTVTLSNVFM